MQFLLKAFRWRVNLAVVADGQQRTPHRGGRLDQGNHRLFQVKLFK
jgi:hypothetical protein